MRRMVGIALAASLSAGSQALADVGDITVMTYNQYVGADFTALAAAEDADQFSAILVEILARIAASNFGERVQRQADQILRRQPDLVGLQEAWTLDCAPRPGPVCDHPAIAGALANHEDETLDALGPDYETVARVRNLALEIPIGINGSFANLQVADYDIILKRVDTVSYAVPVSFLGCAASEDGCNYQVAVPVPFLGDTVDFLRGFVAVEATVRGHDYLFVNTHLEVRIPPVPRGIQSLQAAELIEWLAFLQQTTRSHRSSLSVT